MKKDFVSPVELEAVMQYIHLQLDELEEKVSMAVELERQQMIANQRVKMEYITNAYREIEREFTTNQLEQASAEKEKPLLQMNPKWSY